MRVVVVLLVVANLVLFSYARLDRAAQGESARLSMQIEPARIRPMTAQEVAALAPAKAGVVAAPTPPAASVCAEWGPFAEADRERAQGDLASLALGRLVSTRPVAGETRGAAGAQTMLVVRDARENVVARLRELQGQYPGTELRVAACPAAS
jgi:hypothetical protein